MEYCNEQFIPKGGFCKKMSYLFCQNSQNFINILSTFLPFLQNSTLAITRALVCLHLQPSTFLLLNKRILLISGHYIHSSFKTFPELSVFFTENLDCLGVFNYEFIPESKIVNKEMYVDVCRRLCDAVRRKRSEKWITNSQSLLNNNDPAHRSVWIKDFLAQSNMRALQHPPYFSDLVTADFYTFPLLTSALKERYIINAADFIKNATEELKMLSQFASINVHSIFYSRWQKCTAVRGKYFEENVAHMIVLFYISRK